jgi:AcrR family transcriptional regulator
MGKRGPKRDLELRQRILRSALELIGAEGPNHVTVNQIAAHAGVGKQTIYRWWPTKAAVVIDALEDSVAVESPFADTGSAYRDIRSQMRLVGRSFSSPTGSIIRELLAQSQGDEELAEQFRSRFFAQRRKLAAAAIATGVDRGELRKDLHIPTAIDMLYAPLWLRLMVGHLPLSKAAVDQLLDQVWPALRSEDSDAEPTT